VEKFCKKKSQIKPGKECSICKENNHTEKNCFSEKIGTRKLEMEKEKISFFTIKMKKEEVWIVNSGTTSK